MSPPNTSVSWPVKLLSGNNKYFLTTSSMCLKSEKQLAGKTPHCRRTSVTVQLMKSSGFLVVPPITSPKHCEQLFFELLTALPKNTKRQPRKNQTVQTHSSSPTRCKQTPGSNHRVFMVGEHGTLTQPKRASTERRSPGLLSIV